MRPSTRLASVTVASRAAVAVAGRPGPRAGALRADPQHAALVDPGDRAAAGADRADVDHRDLDRHAPFDLEGGGEALLAADHGRDVGRGAAHVERDQMVDAESSATKRLAITPPVGPESSIWTGASAAASSVISPPFDLMTTAGARHPASSSRPRIGLQLSADDRLEIGVGDAWSRRARIPSTSAARRRRSRSACRAAPRRGSP